MNDLERRRRRRRLLRALALIRLELAVAFTAPLVAAFLFIAAPGTTGGGLSKPSLVEQLLPWAGVAGLILGIVWMGRIYRADPEPGERTWRYREY